MVGSRWGWSGDKSRHSAESRKVDSHIAEGFAAESHVHLATHVARGEGRAREFLAGKRSERHPSLKPSKNNALMAGFAHELKTPLAIIGGYIEILLDGTLGPLNKNQERSLKEAAANCSRLKKLVQEFLSQAALDSQQVTMRLELADFNKCIREVCGFWRQQVQAKNMALYFQADPMIKPFLFDYDKIQHVVSNLLDDALKFTPPGGTIWLTTQRAWIESHAGDDATIASGCKRCRANSAPAIRVTVADTGLGIPAEFRMEVFEEFYRIPNRSNSDGTGLGLSIAERLVQAHGGRIWIEGEPGAGTRVTFLIPVRHEPASADEPIVSGSL